MKDSKEKEHRISHLKDMITNVSSDEEIKEDIEEDEELIDYLNEDPTNYEDLGIDDEFIYHPGDEKDYAINLEENPIDENFIINTPKIEESDEEIEDIDDLNDDFIGDVSENFDNILNAKIGKTPILGIVSTILGLILIVIGALIFNSRADKVIDNVVSGENSFMTIIFVIIGLLLLIYGLYRIIGFKNPVSNLMNNIDSIEKEDKKEESDKEEIKKPVEKTIPKSKIPLDKESYKIGEFDLGEIKNKFKSQPVSKPQPKNKPSPVKEDIEDIPPAREKPEEKKGLTKEEIEEMEYTQAVLDNETIDDIFADVEDIDDLDIISIDSKEDKK